MSMGQNEIDLRILKLLEQVMWCPSILFQPFIEFEFTLQIDFSGFERDAARYFAAHVEMAELDTLVAARQHSDINILEIQC